MPPPSDARPVSLVVEIPSSLDFVGPVRRVLEGLLASHGWGEEDVADVGLVATEVLQNAVEHGSRNDGAEAVRVACTVKGTEILIDVDDPGSGKGPQSLLARDVTVPPPVDSSRGRGLYLVHRMAHELHREHRVDGGGRVRVRFCPAEGP